MPATNAFQTPTAATTLRPTLAPRLGDRTVVPQPEPARRATVCPLAVDQSGSTPDPSGPLLEASFAVASPTTSQPACIRSRAACTGSPANRPNTGSATRCSGRPG